MIKTVSWVEALLNNQGSCAINRGIKTQYFPLQQGVCLEILIILIKNDPNIKGIEIFEYCNLYTAYADDNFFLKR